MKNNDCDETDIAIIGGGLAGLTLAALLGQRHINAICIDRAPPALTLTESFDGRTTAISYGSQKLLAAAGVWDMLLPHACPIEQIDILDGGSPVLLSFSSQEVEGRKFGWIVENRILRHILHKVIASCPTVSYRAPAIVDDFERDNDAITVRLADGGRITARLVVGADGRGSFTRAWAGIHARSWPYRQQAIVCVAAHEKPHDHVAVEHFRAEGPFAILPMHDAPDGTHRSSVVWTVHGRGGHGRHTPLAYDQDAFDAALTVRFPDRYGRAWQVGGRYAYPLGLVHSHCYIAPRIALVAEAAHGIHPIAGQGLNMGFRDIAALGTLVGEAIEGGDDPGCDALLQTYQRQRRFDNMAMAGATDGLNKLFSNNIAPIGLIRRTGLRAVARLPVAKRFFMKQAMGASGLLPDLIRDQKTS